LVDLRQSTPAGRTHCQRPEDRPGGVAFFGTPSIRRLFTSRDTIRARVRVSASGVDWLTVSADWEAEGRQLTDEELAELRSSTSRFVKLPSGWVRREIADAHDETAQLLADVGIEVGQGEQRVNLLQLAGARAESLMRFEHLGADRAAVRPCTPCASHRRVPRPPGSPRRRVSRRSCGPQRKGLDPPGALAGARHRSDPADAGPRQDGAGAGAAPLHLRQGRARLAAEPRSSSGVGGAQLLAGAARFAPGRACSCSAAARSDTGCATRSAITIWW
jgi:hypothetical protein